MIPGSPEKLLFGCCRTILICKYGIVFSTLQDRCNIFKIVLVVSSQTNTLVLLMDDQERKGISMLSMLLLSH